MEKEYTWKDFDYKNPKDWVIRGASGPIKINDYEIMHIGSDWHGHYSEMMKISIQQHSPFILIKQENSSCSLQFLKGLFWDSMSLPKQCLQLNDNYMYVYTSNRIEVTDLLEKYMVMCGFKLMDKKRLPENIHGEKWFEYRFKALYPIETE